MRTQLDEIAAAIPDPGEGLPDAVFDFVCGVTPMINVDLLIQEGGRTLMVWREDAWGTGWHVPGGIIRYGELAERRIAKVAESELGADVEAASAPCAILQLRRSGRGHFISLVYRCSLRQDNVFTESTDGIRRAGDVCWVSGAPDHLYPAHHIYTPFLAHPDRERTSAADGLPICADDQYTPLLLSYTSGMTT